MSAATFTSRNATPWDERNSFVALQGPQVGLEYTTTVLSVMGSLLGSSLR
jgi:hypothetical protein